MFFFPVLLLRGGFKTRAVIGRIQSLELAVEKMRQQQDQLQRRLKGEMERKVKLEVRLVAPSVGQK